jgi:hypothetical protein
MPRPKKHLKPEDYGRLEAMASVGASLATIAKRLGGSKRTLDAIFKRDQRAKETFEAGRGELESSLVNRLFEQAMDPKNKNPTPAIFLLKSMCNYSDQPKPELTENRVSIEFRLPGALKPEQYRELVEVTPRKTLKEACVDCG